MILDTSIIVEIDRGNNIDRIEKLDNEGSHSISAVTVSEFYTGVNMREEPEEDKAERLISRAGVIPLEEEIAKKAGKLIARKKQENLRLGLHDIYIAATAAERDKTVLTKDPEDFNKMEEIEVVECDKY